MAALDVDDEPEEVTPPNPTSHGVTPPNPTQPVAPARDFNKSPNSLDKLALPAGIFPGSSLNLYRALWVRTRGAVVPTRTIRATKRKLSGWSGIRNVKTIDSHLRYFSAIGLVVADWQRGQNDGALYTVFMPEETRGLLAGSRGVTPPNPTSPHVTPPDTMSPQNTGSPHHQNLGSPHLTQVALESTNSATGKTSFKTNTDKDDDEAYARLVSALKVAVKEVTGRESSPAEANKWSELAEVLVTELKIAAGRTTVSSVPAFLAEHLRRRLWKKDQNPLATTAAEPTGEGKPRLTKEQTQKCPDCRGVGLHYPEGYEKGVAKCDHPKLHVTQDRSLDDKS